MKNIEILDREFNRLCFMSNEAEKGLHFYGDALNTLVDSGVYTLEFRVPKRVMDQGHADKIRHVKEGNYLRFRNRQNVPLLMTIMSINEGGNEKIIYAEDTSIALINTIVHPVETPSEPKKIGHYLNEVLNITGFTLGKNESTENRIIELDSNQNALERIRTIIHQFGMEFFFSVNFDNPVEPKFELNVVKRRLEGEEGFTISSDDLLSGIERDVNTGNIVTKVYLQGRAQEVEVSGSNGTGGITQQTATQYDSSKSGGATSVSISGWSESEVNQFRLDAADPPYVNGAYIDTFLRTHYSDSPLIGQGALIKEMADYFGISVGAFMGVVAKETTFGRGEPGKSNHNYGCIRWTSSSGFPSVTWAGSKWNNYPNARTGIAAWFKLIRWSYVQSGATYYSKNYKEMLDYYSPASDGNDQSTFKNIMWGVLKSFGYTMSATKIKTNYSKSTDSALNLQIPSGTAQSTAEIPAQDPQIEAVIAEAMRIRAMKLPYIWGGNGLSGFDCSGFVSWCFRTAKYAGYPTTGRPTTNSMWNGIHSSYFTKISRSEVRRGDIVLWDTGYTFPGDQNHVGIALDGKQAIHTGNPNGIIQDIDSMKVTGCIRVKR